MKIIIERRDIEDQNLKMMTPFLSIFASTLIMSILLAFFGVNPIGLFINVFVIPFTTLYGITNVILKMTPLLLCGIGLALAFRANVWNIGAEGQIIMGAIGATYVALFLLNEYPSIIVIPMMYLMGFIFGGLWALVPAILKAKWNVNEVLTSLMMNYIAIELGYFLVLGPWRGKEVYKYPITDVFPESAWLPVISPRYPIHYTTLILGILSVLGMYVILDRTKFGFEVKTVGSNIDVAKTYGMPIKKVIILTMFISGGLAGIAGVGEVAGIHHLLGYPEKVSAGYGYTAILVAWLANLDPFAVIISAFFLGLIMIGTRFLQVSYELPYSVLDIFIGTMLIILLIGKALTRYKITIRW